MIHCEHQVGFSAVETIRAKQSYERLCMDNGVVVQDYLTDSGAFKANNFFSHIHETQQLLRYCGTNAHHQNGVAERAIQFISNMARAMILHSSIHWKDGIDTSIWPMAVTYTTHIYNNTPNNGVSPNGHFHGKHNSPSSLNGYACVGLSRLHPRPKGATGAETAMMATAFSSRNLHWPEPTTHQ
jgi:hypothetical protein